MRPSWDDTWLQVAQVVAERSLCIRRKVGAVIVTADNRPVSIGYNGPPAGLQPSPICSGTHQAENHGDCCMAIHAEANALLFAARSQYEGGTIYVNHLCCYHCAKLIANSGLARVVIQFENSSRDASKATALPANSGLEVTVIERQAHDEPPSGDAPVSTHASD